MVTGFIPMEMKVCIVKVTSYNDKVLCGSLYNPYFGGEVRFKSHVELFMLMDSMFDDLKFPHNTMKRRTFTDVVPRVTDNAKESSNEKVIASFDIRVHFRQNASWQGTLHWMDKKTEASFRSALELIYLLDSALVPETGEE